MKKSYWMLCTPGCKYDEIYLGEYKTIEKVELYPYWVLDSHEELKAKCPTCKAMCTIISEL